MLKFQVLEKKKAEKYREKFVTCFIDCSTEYYNKHIEMMYDCSDGICYDGYLWDCLKDNQNYQKQCSQDAALFFLQEKKKICVMWDKFSNERVNDRRIFSLKYSKDIIIEMDALDFCRQMDDEWKTGQDGEIHKELWFPEDLYCFDETFTWSVIFTHECWEEGWDEQLRPDSVTGNPRICFKM